LAKWKKDEGSEALHRTLLLLIIHVIYNVRINGTQVVIAKIFRVREEGRMKGLSFRGTISR